MARIHNASIYIRLCRLRHRLKKMQYFLMKKDRIVYGTPALEYCNECLRDFALAYEFQDERAYYYRKLIADFAVLKVELEGINHEGVLRNLPRRMPSCHQRPTRCIWAYSRL